MNTCKILGTEFSFHVHRWTACWFICVWARQVYNRQIDTRLCFVWTYERYYQSTKSVQENYQIVELCPRTTNAISSPFIYGQIKRRYKEHCTMKLMLTHRLFQSWLWTIFALHTRQRQHSWPTRTFDSTDRDLQFDRWWHQRSDTAETIMVVEIKR